MPKKTKNVQYYESIGRRKRSVARVRLYIPNKEKIAQIGSSKIKAGEIYLNNKPLKEVIVTDYEREFIIKPLKLTNNVDRFAVSITVIGGGHNGQLEAIIHGISRAVDEVDRNQYRQLLKKQGLLRRDPRKKERRKVGTGGKSRRVKQSPKR